MQNTAAQVVTYFAPVERASDAELRSVAHTVGKDPVTGTILEAFSGAVMVLNRQRQIVAANLGFLSQDAEIDPEKILLGYRMGEALNCVNARVMPGGCGTSRGCARCGAAIAIMDARTGQPVERECQIRLMPRGGRRKTALELKVRASRIQIGDQECTVLAMQDISDQKRKQALERIFFHDVLNTSTALNTASSLLRREPALAGSLADRIYRLSKRLTDEITEQRDHVSLRPEDVSARRVLVSEVLSELQQHFGVLELESHRKLRVLPGNEERELVTDPTLLVRVLTNMVKNAFEATAEGEEVRVWCDRSPTGLTFKVWNREEIPAEIAERIFEKNFSTKQGPGRGLGTHSMLLLGESYLGGKVGFETSPQGTVFFISLC